MVALQPLGDLPPFFCVHGIGGDVIQLHRLAMHMGTHRPFFGLRRTPDAPLTETINQIAARYVDAILAINRRAHIISAVTPSVQRSPMRWLASSRSKGHEIGLLAIIDQRRPGWRLTVRKAMPVLHRILINLPGRIRDEIAQVPAGERFRHMRRTLLRWSKVVRGIRPHAADMFDFDRRPAEHISLFEAHLRALRSYQPAPVPVPITLFRAEVQLLSHLALDSTLGWRDLAKSEVQVRIVPGSHGSLTAEPFVRQVAKILSDELDAAQGVPRRVEL